VALAVNRACQTVLADSDVSDNADVVRRLSAVLGLPIGVVRGRLSDTSAGAQSQRVITSDATLRDVAFISEHADAFPGIDVEARTQRHYPYGALCAHVLGYTGSPTEDDLNRAVDGRYIESTDTIGQMGIESYYDRLLSGEKGTRELKVNASGEIVNVVSETAATKGSDLHLTIDACVQYVADKALAKLIAPSGNIGSGTGVAASIVALDVRDGSVVAMSNYPTFNPEDFTGSISSDLWDLYDSESAHAPLINRAVNGQYAAASTFKAFSSMAGLYYGFATDGTYWTCTGSWDGFGSGDVQMCWDHDGHGTLNLHEGIVHSCDVVFYEIAKAFYTHGPNGTGEISETALQEYLALYNFGKSTEIDIANESTGRIPTPEWKAERWRNVPSEATWRGGDYTNMIIGQGDVLVTPLQMAAAYGGIATGKIMKPHLLKEVRNSSDEVVSTFEPAILAEPDVNQTHLEYVRSALRDVVLENEVPRESFAAQGIAAAGKSGTAEHSDTNDDAWFVAYAPYDDPHYCVACVVEQGGGGGTVASPLVAEVLGACIKAENGELSATTSSVEGVTGEDDSTSDTFDNTEGTSGKTATIGVIAASTGITVGSGTTQSTSRTD
jgi:penicillin-binding protein 2